MSQANYLSTAVDRLIMNAQPQPRTSVAPSSDTDFVPLTKSPGFWAAMDYAGLSGWRSPFRRWRFWDCSRAAQTYGSRFRKAAWFDGSLWWVAVTAEAGVLVGVLRRALRVPAKLPGTIEEIKEGRVEPGTVSAGVAVSLVSLVGGASLGP